MSGHVVLKERFLTGSTGGPGRPKGSRNKLSEEFLAALCSDWQQHGPSVLALVREGNPAAYLRVIASVVPARIEVEPGSEFANMSDEELRALLLTEIAELQLGSPAGST